MKLSEGINYSVLQKATKVEEYPYKHIIIEDALPGLLYKMLAETRPQVSGQGSNKRYDLSAFHAINQNLPRVWDGFIKYHCSEQFYKEADSLFHFGLRGEVGMRKRDNTPIRLDCQISINTPADEEGRVCEAHIDNPETKWAGLLYMPDDDDDAGGDLEIFDCPNPEYYGKRRVANVDKPVKVVKYKPNMFVCLLNTPVSVHRPTPRKPTKITRKFINFVIDG